MKLTIDFTKLDSAVSHYEMPPEKKAWEKQRKLFLDITEGWESDDDIDYTIAISEMVELIENTADFLNHAAVFSEVLDEVSKSIENSKPVRLRPRLL